jgi:hypothetical protein
MAELREGGRLIERFALIRCPGKGAIWELRRATDAELEEQVAVNIFLRHLYADRDLIALLNNACRKARRLTHPTTDRLR